MIRPQYIIASTLLVLAIMLMQCNKKQDANPVAATPIDSSNFGYLDNAPDTVRLSKHIQPIFTANCALSGCHAGASPVKKLTLENGKAWQSLTSNIEIEHSAADPTQVRLFIKMTYPSGVMPPTGKLPYKQLNLIYQWLKWGGKNN